MKKLYLVILAVAAIAVLGGGYFIYQEYFTYEPSHTYSTSRPLPTTETSGEQPEEIASVSPGEAPSLSSAPEGMPSGQAGLTSDLLDLKPKWKVGNRYVFRTENVSESETRIPNRRDPLKTTQKLTQDFAISILNERPDGGHEAEFEIVGMKMDTDTEGKKLTYDSTSDAAADANNPLAPMLQTMVGLKLKYTIDADGKVKEVAGAESFQESMERTLTKAPPEVESTLKAMFSEKSLKDMFKNFEPVADKPVKVGETWNTQQELTLPALGKTVINIYYTFKEWDKQTGQRLAFVQFSGNMDVQSKKGADLGPMNISLENAFFTGKSWYNPDIGIGVETQIDQDITMLIKTKMRVRGKMQEQQIRSKVKNQASTKLIEIAPFNI